MSNRLKDESSPYLQQHSENPVDWYPWCKEAFERAEREDKPVFLSIGYSTCHWCHVMAHESFENQEIAGILNKYFISIKVDREERPDIDSVYMSVCQAITGSGGWPMSIFMTAQQKPFYAGTYFPASSRYGMPGFGDLLLWIAGHWRNKREELLQSADQILAYMSDADDSQQEEGIDGGLPERAAESLSRSFDEEYGGFGAAPKFPMAHNLIFLTLYAKIHQKQSAALEPYCHQVEMTLDRMRRGGLFDQIGYGFSRYSTDRYYLVPHFEKMLYDNALLILAYVVFYSLIKQQGGKAVPQGQALSGKDGYKISEAGDFLDTAEKTAFYILREMTGDEGQFYSAQDADSDGEEGKYYVWDYQEVCRILGKDRGTEFCRHFGITPEGNFEGKNIPNLLNGNDKGVDIPNLLNGNYESGSIPSWMKGKKVSGRNHITGDFDDEIRTLYDYRKSRAKLHLDDKVLTAWNSLMICGLSVLYRVTGREQYLEAAKRAQCYIEKNLTDGDILYVSCRNGVRSGKGFLDDYAYYTAALLFLYEAGGGEKYLERARRICDEARRQFEDRDRGGYFLYGTENDRLITKPKEVCDGALPSGNSVMAYCLVRLSQITEDENYEQAARSQLAYLSGQAGEYPSGCSVFLIALLLWKYPPQKITVVLPRETAKREGAFQEQRCRLPLYGDIRVLEDGTEGYKVINGRTTYYVCKGHTCLPPVNDLIKEAMD